MEATDKVVSALLESQHPIILDKHIKLSSSADGGALEEL
jgi:hypothetical protein